MSGNRNYFYSFDELSTDDVKILEPPTVTVDINGKIPKRPKGKDAFFNGLTRKI